MNWSLVIGLAVGLAVGLVVMWLTMRGRLSDEKALRRLAEQECGSETTYRIGHAEVAQDEAAAAASSSPSPSPPPYDNPLDTTAVAGFPPVRGDELGDFAQHEIQRGRPA